MKDLYPFFGCKLLQAIIEFKTNGAHERCDTKVFWAEQSVDGNRRKIIFSTLKLFKVKLAVRYPSTCIVLVKIHANNTTVLT